MPPRKKTEPKPKDEELTPQEFDERLEDGEAVELVSEDEGPVKVADFVEAPDDSDNEWYSDPEPEPPVAEVKTLEPLEVNDLVFDDGKVRALRSLFPVTVDDRAEQRLYVVEVPGEDGTLAIVWYTNTQDGPVLVIPVTRLRAFDEGTFTTVDGRSYSYHRSSGCGCGNRLKYWRPWEGWVRVVQLARR